MTNPSPWFERRIQRLAGLLRRLRADRRRAFSDVLEGASATESHDRKPRKGEPTPENDRAPERLSS